MNINLLKENMLRFGTKNLAEQVNTSSNMDYTTMYKQLLSIANKDNTKDSFDGILRRTLRKMEEVFPGFEKRNDMLCTSIISASLKTPLNQNNIKYFNDRLIGDRNRNLNWKREEADFFSQCMTELRLQLQQNNNRNNGIPPIH